MFGAWLGTKHDPLSSDAINKWRKRLRRAKG